MNHSNKYCHLAHDDGQQQQAVAAAATAVQQHTTEQQQTYVTGIHKYIHVRRAAAYSTIIIRQVKVLCFETAHGVYVTKRGTAVITTHSRVAAAAAAAALCMHIRLISRLLRRHLNYDRWSHIFLHWNEKKGNGTQKK